MKAGVAAPAASAQPEGPAGPVGVALLGSTGSIGTSALRVLDRQRHRFVPVALTAHSNRAALAEQVAQWTPACAGLYAGLVAPRETPPPAWGTGADCLVEAATHPDAAIVIMPWWAPPICRRWPRSKPAQRRAGQRESVAATFVPQATCGELPGRGSAILQCLAGHAGRPHSSSPGPFGPGLQASRATVSTPCGSVGMGGKITVDSAALANKAPSDRSAPPSACRVASGGGPPANIVHSFVEFVDERAGPDGRPVWNCPSCTRGLAGVPDTGVHLSIRWHWGV